MKKNIKTIILLNLSVAFLLIFASLINLNKAFAEDKITDSISIDATSTGYTEGQDLGAFINWNTTDSNDYGYKVEKEYKGSKNILEILDPYPLGIDNLSNGGQLLDNDVKLGETYTYNITAFDRGGNESDPATVTITITRPEDEENVCITKLEISGAVDNSQNVLLNWDAVCNADEYKIYKDNNYLNSTIETSYLDPSVPVGEYTYTVEAWGPINEQSNSSEINIIQIAKAADNKTKKISGQAKVKVITNGGTVLAASSNNTTNSSGEFFGSDFKSYFTNFYAWSIGIAGMLAIIMLIYAGYLYVSSAGNQEQVGQAKEIIIGAIAGLLLLIIAGLVLRSLGVGA